MKRLVAVVLLGVLGAGYTLLYNYLEDTSRGLLVFFSLLTAVVVARPRKEAR